MIINIEKATGLVKDIGETYDPRYFDNAEYPDGTIPAGDVPQMYKRVASAIVKLTVAEYELILPALKLRRLKTKWLADAQALVDLIQALPAGPQKTILLQLLVVLRDLAQFTAME